MIKQCNKRLFVVLISMIAVLLLSSSVAFAASSGECGDLTWTLNSSGVLTISGSGEMEEIYDEDEDYWRPNKASIKKLVINSGVTSISDWAFADCSNLTTITLPSTLEQIGDGAFENCTGITSITLPDSVTAIGEYAFKGTSITSITTPVNWTEIPYGVVSPFAGSTKLKTVVIPEGATVVPGYAFCGNSDAPTTSITSITLPSTLEQIGDGAFENCTGITSITLPDSVTAIGE